MELTVGMFAQICLLMRSSSAAGLTLLLLFRDLFAGPITKGSQIFPLHAQRAFFFIESYELFLSQLEALCFEPLVDPIKLFPNQGSI